MDTHLERPEEDSEFHDEPDDDDDDDEDNDPFSF